MWTKFKNLPSWLKGGVIGLFMPLFSIIGLHLGIIPFVIPIAFMSIPITIIGGALELPIIASDIGFLFPDFNIFGYILIIMFWTCVGTIIGWIIGKIKSKWYNY